MRRLTQLRFVILILFCCAYLPVPAQQPAKTAELTKRLQVKLDSLQKANGFPGATFSIVLPSGEQLTIATGLADSVSNTPMRPDNRMFSGSNGKTLFAASAMVLAEQGVFSLDDKIEKYIGKEAWFNRIPNARSITMRMLLNHTSGIEEYYELGDFMHRLQANHTWTPVEILAYVFDRKPLFEAGTAFGYADTNYILFGYIIEKISGKKMYDLADKYVVKPYRLKATEPSVKMKYKNLAVGYVNPDGPFPVKGAFVKDGQLALNPQFEWTGGGYVSSAADLATWAKAYYNLKSISPALRGQMRQGVAANTGKDHLYGLGMQIRPGGAAGMGYGHSGWFPGYLTDAEYFPELDLAMAIQFNTDNFRLLKRTPHAYLLDMAKIIAPVLQNP
ncbi:beta-lactamase family protein [Pontibacter sp. Tf4]|uniref:serine hydrolase domain-containing protein n=1 Tax=Pontibacter sp. Tf4 TaxID=2761620 RepID=UPI0016275EF9|nr:serine hydrolase domain-containing protein [Pontibacter sp. Tf4]MBB6612370.1 beta-lactamase family protein [Pontibacter sp. Tf4]